MSDDDDDDDFGAAASAAAAAAVRAIEAAVAALVRRRRRKKNKGNRQRGNSKKNDQDERSEEEAEAGVRAGDFDGDDDFDDGPDERDDDDVEVRRVVSHFRRCLTRLSLQQRSMRIGLDCLSNEAWPRLLRQLTTLNWSSPTSDDGSSCSSSSSQLLFSGGLQRFFAQLIRLHDGLVLLESGECRHPGDVRRARKEEGREKKGEKKKGGGGGGGGEGFGSRLTGGGSGAGGGKRGAKGGDVVDDGSASGCLRRDGYTRLYRRDRVYSGTGWDEITDPRNGLQTRLGRAVRRMLQRTTSGGDRQHRKRNFNRETDDGDDYDDSTKSNEASRRVWDRYFADLPAVESVLNRLETSNQMLQRDLTQFTRTAESSLARALQSRTPRRVSVQLSLADKMESLVVSIGGGGYRLQLERRGDDFQIRNEPEGALPPNYARKDWERVMAKLLLPAAATEGRGGDGRGGDANTTNRKNHYDNGKGNSSDKVKNSVVVDKKSDGQKKKRRVIQDSSDEDDERGGGGTAAAASGLRVKVSVESKNKPGASVDGDFGASSLDVIKQQMGVNVQALAASRDCLEAEEKEATIAAAQEEWAVAASSSAAGVDTSGNAGDDSDAWRELEGAERRYERMSRLLRKLCHPQQEQHRRLDDGDSSNDRYSEIWDARESARQAAMDAGNLYLATEEASPGQSNKKSWKVDSLSRATVYFEKSKDLVRAQEILHREIAASGTLPEEDSALYGRNLILLLGQAHVNAGIAKVELCRRPREEGATGNRKVLLREARHELDGAKSCAIRFRDRARADRDERGYDFEETTSDMLESKKLESLSLRWLGILLWLQGKRAEATQLFENVTADDWGFGESRMANEGDNTNSHVDYYDETLFFDFKMTSLVERYHSATTLADLVVAALEHANVSPTRPEDPVFGQYEDLFACLSRSIEKSTQLSRTLRECFGDSPNQSFLQDHGILSEEDLAKSLQDIRDWWRRKTVLSLQPSLSGTRDRPHDAGGRSDISSAATIRGARSSVAAPAKRFVVDGSGRTKRTKKKQQQRWGGGVGYSNIGSAHYLDEDEDVAASAFTSNDNQHEQQQGQRRKYRKWGDELLAASASNPKIPKTASLGVGAANTTYAAGPIACSNMLTYPSVAPEMPPEIKAALLAAKSRSNSEVLVE